MNRLTVWSLLVGTLAGAWALASAQSQTTIDAPTSLRALKALAAYNDGVRRLDDEYEQRLGALRQQYVNELDAARKSALAVDDLEEATRLLFEKRRMDAQRPQPGTSKGLVVLSALCGVNERWVDVTPKVRRLIKGTQLHFTMSDLSNVPDVAPGVHKSVVIAYVRDGSAHLSNTSDAEAVDIPAAR